MKAFSIDTFVIETDEENPRRLAEVTASYIAVADGFRVRGLSGSEIDTFQLKRLEEADRLSLQSIRRGK